MKRTFSKKVVAMLLALIAIAGCSTIFANAGQEELGGVNGYLIPTDINLSAPKTDYTFYGDSAYLYFMLFSMGKADSFYNIEIYSKSDYDPDSVVSSFVAEYGKKGNAPLRLNWPFKSNPSGTYYGRCYTTIIKGEEEIIDTSTIYKFTIRLNRIGKSEVPLVSVTNAKKGVVVKWDKLPTATKYRIYRKANNASSWTKLADVNGSTNSYTDTKVKSGTQYSYTVKAFDKLYSSLYNKTGLKTYYLSTPTLTAPKASTSIYPVVKWSKVAGCDGYYIYRKGGSLNNSNKWKRIATIKNSKTLSYTDKSATSSDWEYTYTIRAYHIEKVKKYDKNKKAYYENVVHLSAADSKGATYNCASAPILKTVESAVGGVKITWLDTNTAKKKFYIYRKAAGEQKWTCVGSSTTPSFVDKKVSNGITYTYTVRTATATNLSSFDKKGISTRYILTPSLKKLSINANGTTTISWSTVSGSQGYAVYKSTNGGKWTKLATIKNPKTTSYKDTAKKNSGTTYSYTVRAYYGSYYSSYVKSGLTTMYLTSPTVTVKNDFSEDRGSTVKITWKAVSGAKSYRIYRKTASDKSWSVIADNVTSKTYFDKTAKSGSKYYYTVRAKNGSYLSNYTSSALFTVIGTPILTDAVMTDGGVKVTWEAVGGAQSYRVYRRQLSGSWEIVGTSITNEFIDKTAGEIPYIYTVRAISGNLVSNYMGSGITNFVSVDAVDLFIETTPDNDAAFVTITWTGTGADSYEIYRSADGAEPVHIANVSSTEALSFIDDDLTQGVDYYYTVTPIKEGKLPVKLSSETVVWEFSPVEIVPVITVPAYATVDTLDRIDIYWESVEAAESYEIYRKTDDTEWIYLTTVEGNQELKFSDTAIETDITYYYSVKGIASDRESLFDEIGTSAILYGPIEEIKDVGVFLTNDPNNADKKVVTIAWEVNEDVSFYKVMRKAGDGDWEIMSIFINADTDTSSLVFVDSSIEQGIEYTYAIHTYAPDRPSINNYSGKTVIWEVTDPTPPEDTTEDTTIPDTTEPGTSEPDTTVPDTTEPDTSEPETTLPDTTEPDTSEPETTVPDTTNPETTTD